jgi:hypothetical protein
MNPEIIATILSAILSLLGAAGILRSSDVILKLLRLIMKKPEQAQKTFTERLADLTANLTKASSEVDKILAELADVARDRTSNVQRLEADLSALEAREKQLKEKIDALEKTPIPVADHFAELLKKGEKRSAKRDYALFGAGVIVTSIIAVVIQLLSNG